MGDRLSALTSREQKVLELLAAVWNEFLLLPEQHPMHRTEFAAAIHAAQHIVMSRPTARDEGWIVEPMEWVDD